MKKLIGVILAATIISTVLSGCSTDGKESGAQTTVEASAPLENGDQTASAETMAPKVLTFASQSVGSTAYARTAALVQVMNKKLPAGWSIEVQPISAGGPAGTLLVEAGTTDIGEGINISNKLLAEGKYQSDIETLKNCSSILGGTDYAYYLIMFTEEFQKKTGASTLEEVIESKTPFRLVTKSKGSAGELGASQLLDVLGVKYEDITSWGGEVFYIAPAEMGDMLKEGRADISIDIVGLGQAAMSELTLTKTMYFPQLTESTLQGLYGLGYVEKEMPANSWGGQTSAIRTAVNSANITVSNSLPEDIVYAMTKAICENKNELVELVPVMEQYDPELSGEESRNGLPLHPGAKKYYEEKGWEY